MKYVYLLKSIKFPKKRYIGLTEDFQRRLEQHNDGQSKHTSKFAPWTPVVVVQFMNDAKAEAFEKYLKIGSGHAFAERHFW